MKRINVLCAMRDTAVVERLSRNMGERCTFFAVKNGEAALALAGRETPDILVIDAVLPYMDGIGVIDRMRGMLGGQMPEVIGGSVQSFADGEFARRGVKHRVSVPWDRETLQALIGQIIEHRDTYIDWDLALRYGEHAGQMLTHMGMNERLCGFTYLALAAGMARENEERLDAIWDKLYVPIAARQGTTPQSVERLIRHAVERTCDSVGEHGIYSFFGNTIDPMRGKPTNAQMIAMLTQRLRLS